ncbi:hypothetical protein H7K45_16490 [Mycobacterium yunnanensis]|uniref:Uncharacterized protein n=1 Tax=Mycobacterium yunnanensis TaxID=368477 RepID=A0A9X3BTZ3_9MYCO|nr:hypothetical protein [Mycobacterium yunnanensis]MCV7422149.1 hypothetical protein [Mycobacterium yunnanensis]
MSSPATRAKLLRGVLVGGCSALLTAFAHTVGGGDLPAGAAVPTLLLVCATVGAFASRVPRIGRHADVAALVAALGGAQLLGHVALIVDGGHHGAVNTSGSMLAAHAGAAIVLAVLINFSEWLYVLASSVSTWLRLVVVDRSPARVTQAWQPVDVGVPPVRWWRSGLGMRAPPAWSPLGA